MKKLYILFTSVLFASLAMPAAAQMDCSDGRYYNRTYFADYDTTENILFGSGPAVGNGQTQNLKMCVFQPAGDQLAKRPLIVFTFGGSFVTGARQDVYDICAEYAKMGYVVAATDYRVGFFLPDQTTTTMAVVRGMHDMKAAVRYFYKDAQTTNTFKIDTNYIIVGGVSAGAICAIHTAYLDNDTEIPSYLYGDTAGMGGVEGLSGNQGYSSKIAGVIDFSGTIGDTAWIDAGDAPIVGLHYTGDQTVPFGTGPVSVNGFNTGLTASGTETIMLKTDMVGIPNALKTYQGTGHVNYLQTLQARNEAIDFTKLFIGDLVCGSATLSVNDKQDNSLVSIFPNPSNGIFNITLNNPDRKQFFCTLYDVTGKEVKTLTTLSDKIVLDCNGISAGIYQVAVTDGTTRFTQKVVLN